MLNIRASLYKCVGYEGCKIALTCHMQEISADGHTDQTLTHPPSSEDSSTSALPHTPAAKARWKMFCIFICDK